jgi:hypothetical protein
MYTKLYIYSNLYQIYQKQSYSVLIRTTQCSNFSSNRISNFGVLSQFGKFSKPNPKVDVFEES